MRSHSMPTADQFSQTDFDFEPPHDAETLEELLSLREQTFPSSHSSRSTPSIISESDYIIVCPCPRKVASCTSLDQMISPTKGCAHELTGSFHPALKASDLYANSMNLPICDESVSKRPLVAKDRKDRILSACDEFLHIVNPVRK